MEVKKILKLKNVALPCVLIAVMVLTGCGKSSSIKNNNNNSSNENNDNSSGDSQESKSYDEVERFNVEAEFKKWELETEYDASEAVDIILKDNDSSCSSDKVSINNNTITIAASGVYVLAGKLTDGNIIVDSKDDENVRLIFNGLDIESSTTSPLYIKSAKNVIITLEDGKENNFKDSESYKLDESSENADSNEPNAVIFSKDDLIINGTGTLNVYADYNHGIQSKDDLKIISGNINIESVGDSIVGKDSVVIKEGNINLTSQQHGIKSNNYSQDKGYVYIGEADININAKEDGINSCTCTRINGGNINISAGDDGMHSDVAITIDAGNIVIKESYEGIESQYITINGGNINLVSEDDGFNASSGKTEGENDSFMPSFDNEHDMKDKNLENMPDEMQGKNPGNMHDMHEENWGNMPDDMQGGNMPDDDMQGGKPENMPDDMQGRKPGNMPDDMQGEKPENMPDDMQGGKPGNMSDDMQGGKPGNMSDKMHGDMSMGGFDSDENCYLVINGGSIKVNAGGDGLDSNGYIEINGGEVYIDGPTNSGNGALDYGISCKVTGGILVAAGSIGMAEAPTEESTQYSVSVALNTSCNGGTKITIKDESGKEIVEYAPSKTFQSFVFSTEELKEGQTYFVFADGVEKGTFTVSGIITNVRV